MVVTRVIGWLEPGGAQLSALRLSATLRDHGVQTRFLAGDATPAGLSLAREHGVDTEAFRSRAGLQWEPSPAFADWLAPRLRGADLVHGHMFGGWWAAAWAAPTATPVVASEHNAIVWPGRSYDEAAARMSGRLARFFAHGPAARAWASSIGVPPSRLERGESAIAGFGCAARPGLPTRRLTFAGRLKADKAPDVLVEALALLADPPASYLLGDGPLGPALRARVAELGLDAVVRLPGWQRDPAPYVAGAAVHVVPSREEASSQSAVLAMGLGVPVVGTAVEGLPETLGDGRGILVAPEDPEALAAAIDGVLSGRLVPDLAGARSYALRFAPERIAQRYASIYRELLAPAAEAVAPA